MADRLVVRGAREHNLRDVSLDLPRDKLIVFTGLSGSGKSSLAFDTIYAEGQRRYVESLSAYARQFLGQMDKPDVDFIEGLSPAISIDQKSASRNPRSTVGTITEVYDYLRLLYARIGHPHCPTCGRPVARQTPQQIVDRVLELPEGTRFQVLAPVVRGRKGEYSTLLDDLAKQGFARVRVDGIPVELSERSEVALARYETHTIEVVVDRLIRRDGIRQRLTESIETALELTGGTAEVLVMNSSGATGGAKSKKDAAAGAAGADGIESADGADAEGITFSQHLACTHCGISFDEPAPRSFSFNSPYGACPTCVGLGTKFEVDPELVVPDESLSLADGALAPWAGARSEYFSGLQAGVAELGGFSVTTPWKSLKAKDKKLVLYGTGTKSVHIRYKNRFNRTRSYEALFEGIVPWLQRRHGEAESDWSREQVEQYMREVDCPACHGARLKPESLAVTVGGRNIYELCSLSIGAAVEEMGSLELSDREHMIADRVFKEVRERMQFLLDVGLDYLSLSRSAGTLSGGEAQRIRLASQIGSGLVGVLYVLDEPSIGLHQRDNQRLIGTLERLRNLGNTVIVVEHDEETIRTADYVVDIGPGAGEHGGSVVHAGPVTGRGGLLSNKASITGQYLSGKRSIPVPARRRPGTGEVVTVRGAREHNLKGIDVSFPLGCLVAVTGVSGSGKSTLGQRHPAAGTGPEAAPGQDAAGPSPDGRGGAVSRQGGRRGPGPHRPHAPIEPGHVHGRVRPHPQTLRPDGGSQGAGLPPGPLLLQRARRPLRGLRRRRHDQDRDALPPRRVRPLRGLPRGPLQPRHARDHVPGQDIADVLDMSCEEALSFFSKQPPIARHMQTMVDVGLGYVRLGQPAPTLSGGEAQRVKLASELSRRPTGHTFYILDEPTTGLHFEDTRRLLEVLGRLVDQGNTVVVIEHNLDVIKTADWVIDLGPEGGNRGGTVVAEGTPEQVAKTAGSYTGDVLKPVLAKAKAKIR